MRLIIGPSGSGKTSTVLKYCEQTARETLYFSLADACDAAGIKDLLRTALDVSPAQCREIVVDEIDNGTPEAIAELMRLVEEAPENITLIYVGRSRQLLDARRLIARGVGVVCDARRLAFDAEEAGMLAEACGIAAGDLELRRLIEDTDGWAMAVSSAIRTAAAENETLDRAYQLWRAQSQGFLHDFAAAELQRVPIECRQAFWQLYNGETPDAERLRELDAHGLFVTDDGRDGVRLYRALRPSTAKATPAVNQSSFTPPLMVSMFRSFSARIENREIPWVRRRDQQIVKYLLLKPNGTATRSELASIFWSDSDRHLATQSVRTACSTIRKAFAAIVGPGNVDLYFRTAPDIQVDFANVVCDVRRFTAHMNDGDADFDRGLNQDASMHYRAAEKLYAGRLLEFESPEPWIIGQANLMQDRLVQALERLGTLALEHEEIATATQYANRALAVAPDHPGAQRLYENLERMRIPQRDLPRVLHSVS
ncbi:MAG TPA: BTAD domain-containing putative transcriptional regulator [Candidatus Baltobacteraceae bacterium]|nr:BTAD domain-containing putative transcriptional regulator [Candidatus Baltobacteraceae bacterium]